MKQLIFPIFLLVSILIAPNCVVAQTPTTISLQNQIEKYTSSHIQEKIYLHTDRLVYLTNEVCWFKIYNTDALFNKPLGISKVAYIELVNENKQSVLQEKVSIQNGSGNGSIQFPNNLPSGNYILRAYTNWMKNFSPHFFFTKQIKLINTQLVVDTLKNNFAISNHIQWFPEGGNLIHGINTVVAFKASNAAGHGMEAKGFIVNENGDTVTALQTLRGGIGSFHLLSDKQHSYKAIINFNDGTTSTVPLPQVNTTGIALKIVQDEQQTVHAIAESNQDNTTQNALLFLIVHSRGIVKKAIAAKLTNGKYDFEINQNELGIGINTFTLFDENKRPISERLYFRYPPQSIEKAELLLESTAYKNRANVNLRINKLEKKDQLNMSMSVYKIDALQTMDELNIQNYFLLNSDLSEYVTSPNAYFDPNNESRFLEMDNLMLTNGWRRFNWTDVFNNNQPSFTYLPEIAGSIIKGKIVQLGSNTPISESTGYVSMPSLNTQFRSSLSDANGNLHFQFDHLYNDGQIIVQADSSKNFKNKLEIESPFYSTKSIGNLPVFSMASINKLDLSNYHRNVQVQGFYNNNLIAKYSSKEIDSNAFYHTPDYTYFLDNYSRFSTMEEVIREYVTPISLTKTKDKFKFSVYDDADKRFFTGTPLLLLDGVVIKDMDKFMEYDPLKIRKLEVVSRLYYLGNLAYNGIINFSTYTGKMEGYELDPNSIVLDYKGLQAKREFAAPVYETQNQIDNRLPDFRHLLYWNPNIILNKEHTKKLNFYTSDVNGKYAIVLQGISTEGDLIYKTQIINIQP